MTEDGDGRMPGEDGEQSRWLTYAEAAQQLGIDAESVKRRAQRQKWPRREGNDRKTRVAVPASAFPGGDITGDVPPAPRPGNLSAMLEEALAQEREAREALAVARVRLATAEATVEAQAKELRRWLRSAPTRSPKVLLRRLSKVAKPTPS